MSLMRFGATLLIAIIAAELFNQGNWQRVYACRDGQTVRRSFLGAALVILPMILLSGLLGLMTPIAAQGYSVLYLFFVADLLCATLVFPLIFSLDNRYQTAHNAFVSSAISIAVGVLFFPKPNFSPLFNIPGGGDLLNSFLNSFAAALVTSMVVTLLWNTVRKNNKKSTPFNYLI